MEYYTAKTAKKSSLELAKLLGPLASETYEVKYCKMLNNADKKLVSLFINYYDLKHEAI